jgi:hypothetical protein
MKLVTLHPYWFIILLCGDISFHVLVTSLHHHNSLMGMRVFSGELDGFGLNQSLGVDGLVCTFICCNYWIVHGDILTEHTYHRSLMNYSLITTLGKGFLDCYVVIFFSNCGLGESIDVSSFDKGNQCHKHTSITLGKKPHFSTTKCFL